MPTITHVTVRNGLTLALVVAFVNTGLQLLTSFGVHMTDTQRAGITAFVNAAVMLGARVLSLPEKTAAGGTVKVEHVPQLVVTPPPEPTPPVAAAVIPTPGVIPPTAP